MQLADYLIKKFGLQPDKTLMSALDIFKMYRDYDGYITALTEIQPQLTGYDAHICQLELDPRRRILYLLTQNHFTNHLHYLNFILTNPELIKGPLFQEVYRQRQLITEIADHIINLYVRLQQPFLITLNGKQYQLELQTFYNDLLLTKFLNNLDFDYLSAADIGCHDDNHNHDYHDKSGEGNISCYNKSGEGDSVNLLDQYREVCQLMLAEADKLKIYLRGLLSDTKWSEHPKTGMSQFPIEIYQFAFEYQTGLSLTSGEDFKVIKKWCLKQLTELQQQLVDVADQLLSVDNDDVSDNNDNVSITGKLSLEEKLAILKTDESQLWSSKDEMASAYQACADKYCRLYYETEGYEFTKFNQPSICIFDNPSLTGGYYYANTFYLNVSSWQQDKRCDVETLTLHEVVPGHHLQLDYSTNSQHTSALNFLIQEPFNGFIEGWGLFCEGMSVHNESVHNESRKTPSKKTLSRKSHADSTKDVNSTSTTGKQKLWDRVGYLDANLFRTFRILAEIMLHVEGNTPAEVAKLAKSYITYNDAVLESEAYRYRVYPGQACAYKVGLEVIRHVVKSKFPDIDVTKSADLHRPELLAFYKHFLLHHEMPLQDLLTTYGVSFNW